MASWKERRRELIGTRAIYGISLALLSSVLTGFVQAESVRLASYNLRNYLTMDRIADGGWRPEYPKPESEKAVVRGSILAVRPDILALQEIGGAGHLEELRRDLSNEGLTFDGFALMPGLDETRHVAALWRRDLLIEARYHDDLEFNYLDGRTSVRRGLLELVVGSEVGSSWSIFVVHLKSKYTNDERDYQSAELRLREARAVRDRILERYPDPSRGRFILVGDLNDFYDSRPLRAVLKRGKTAILQAIPCRDEAGDQWTHLYERQFTYARIDYLLRSPGFAELGGVGGHILRRRDFYAGSDHRPLWVNIVFDVSGPEVVRGPWEKSTRSAGISLGRP